MLNEPATEPVPVAALAAAAGIGAGAAAGAAGGASGGGAAAARAGGVAGDVPGAGNMRYIQVTPQEKEAIERVRSTLTLSFSPEFTSLILTSLFTSRALVNMKTFASLGIVL